jgi:hypothetical protein
MHSNISRRIDPDDDFSGTYFDNSYDNVVANQNLLVFLPCKAQHRNPFHPKKESGSTP